MLKYKYDVLHKPTGTTNHREVVAPDALGFLKALTKWNREPHVRVFYPTEAVADFAPGQRAHPDTL